MFGSTLEGNQLRHCTAKLSGYQQTQVCFYTRHALIQGPTEYESDTPLPTKSLGIDGLMKIQ